MVLFPLQEAHGLNDKAPPPDAVATLRRGSKGAYGFITCCLLTSRSSLRLSSKEVRETSETT